MANSPGVARMEVMLADKPRLKILFPTPTYVELFSDKYGRKAIPPLLMEMRKSLRAKIESAFVGKQTDFFRFCEPSRVTFLGS